MAKGHLKELYFLVTLTPAGGEMHQKPTKDGGGFPANSYISESKQNLRREERQRELNAESSLLAPRTGHTNLLVTLRCTLVLHCFAHFSLWDCLTEADKPQKEEWEGSSQELGNRKGKTCMANPGQR